MRGSVRFALLCFMAVFISIHASTWEAARQLIQGYFIATISIHASTWEAAGNWDWRKRWYLFQFTPLHERQPVRHQRRKWSRLFQFTPLHERQHIRLFHIICYNLFQFTPLHERQQQKYTIFSIKSTQFSTKPCFFIVTSRKVVFFSIPVQYFL